MKSDINIEWLVEELDFYEGCEGEPDIIDPHHFDTYAEAKRFAESCKNPTRIGLVRDLGNDVDGLIDRQWAYLEDGKLPERFDWCGDETGGAKVPASYHRELERGS